MKGLYIKQCFPLMKIEILLVFQKETVGAGGIVPAYIKVVPKVTDFNEIPCMGFSSSFACYNPYGDRHFVQKPVCQKCISLQFVEPFSIARYADLLLFEEEVHYCITKEHIQDTLLVYPNMLCKYA